MKTILLNTHRDQMSAHLLHMRAIITSAEDREFDSASPG
jgi:hypothetical protein